MKKLILTLILLLTCTQVWADSSFTCDRTLIEDAAIIDGIYLQYNWGGRTEWWLGTLSSRRYSALTKVLNISDSLPAGKSVDSACFQFYYYAENLDASDFVVSRSYAVLINWVEGTSNGVAEVGACSGDSAIKGTTDWNTDVCEGVGTDRSATAQSDGIHADSVKFEDGGSGVYVKFWLTPATVEGWRDGTNYGIVIRYETTDDADDYVSLNSAEHSTGGEVASFVCYYSDAGTGAYFKARK